MLLRWLALAAIALELSAAPEKHVRVILDISQSMRGTRTDPANDPSGHALISVGLLYDLARYELGPDGSFRVLPFDVPASAKCPSSVPRTVTGSWISPVAGGRDPFIRRILDLTYDAPCTFFFPYLEAGLRDLETTRKGDDVKRILVLVTDGLTEDLSKKEEADLLTALTPRLIAAGVDLYVLAFGRTAAANEAFFRPIFHFRQSGGTGGSLLADPAGTQLVENMIKIFEMSFSYKAEMVTGTRLDLRGGNEQRHVAVVAINDPPREPRFSVYPPSGGAGVSVKGAVAAALGREVPKVTPPGSGRPVSYGVLWINGPAEGGHEFRDSVSPKKLAILRPRNLRVELSKSAMDVAMIDSPMHLQAIVKPADGGSGDPGAVNLQFRVFAVRKPDSSGYEYHPPEDWIPAATPAGKYEPGVGRVYEIQPVFQQAAAFNKPAKNGTWWDGYIEVRAQSDGNTLTSLDKNQHSVRIYPRLSLRPDPDHVTPMHRGSATLRGAEEGCSLFMFRAEGAPLRDTDYTLSASVDEKLLTGAFRGAKFRLNSTDLGQWQRGRKMSRQDLTTSKLEVCLSPAKKNSGGKGLELPVRFSLSMSEGDPYQRLDVVRPLIIVANLEPVGFLSRFWPLLLLFLFLLLLGVLLSRLRHVLAFPPDFRTALAEGAVPRVPSPKPLAEAAIWNALFRAHPPRPVSSMNGKLLGEVVPVDSDLFSFHPATGFAEVTHEDDDGRNLLPRQADGGVMMAAHHLYRVKGSDGSIHHIRLEYEPPKS